MEDKRKIKYYHIRANIFWIGLIVALLVFAVLIVYIIKNKPVEDTVESNVRLEKIYMGYGNITSELADQDECHLCGNADSSMVGYYKKFDTIGVIDLNEWYVLDLRLKEYDEAGNPVSNSEGTSSSFGNPQGMNFNVSATPSRGMAHATVSSDNGTFDESFVQKHLCQTCLDKVTESLEGYFEKGKEEYLPFCLVDFRTLDIYSLQEINKAYFVRDYWVDLEHNENEIEISVYYLPLR